MTERACIRDHLDTGIHIHGTGVHQYRSSDKCATEDCPGCAPVLARDGSLICDRCYGRLRGLLRDTPDLYGRMMSTADPLKAKPFDEIRVQSSAAEAPAPVGADLLDAVVTVAAVLDFWLSEGEEGLRAASNHLESLEWLFPRVLDRHLPDDDGIRHEWSVADAKDHWGLERRTRDEEWVDEPERVEVVTPIPEWLDPWLTREEAAKLAGSDRSLRRWMRAGHIAPVHTIVIAGRVTGLFLRSHVLRVREMNADRMRRGVSEEGNET